MNYSKLKKEDFENIESQNEYYNDYNSNNNDSYYSNNYSDTSYNYNNTNNSFNYKYILIAIILMVVILLCVLLINKSDNSDEKYDNLKNKICNAAKTFVDLNPSIIDISTPGKTVTIKLEKLSNANLIEARLDNPNYDNSIFSKNRDTNKYYSLDNSIRLTVYENKILGCELIFNSTDVIPPIITLNGDSKLMFVVGTNYVDPGYNAVDDYDGNITDRVVRSGNVDKTVAGEYTINYSVSDSAGNTTTITREIIYEEYSNMDITLSDNLDKVTPIITLKGDNPYCMVKGTKYIEPGATAADNIDGDITNKIAVTNKITGNILGSFRVKYEVEDSSGNSAIAYRAVIVTTNCNNPNNEPIENSINTSPEIIVNGVNSIAITLGEQYIDRGATARDKEDGNLTNKIITVNDININTPGVYHVYYRVMDSKGLIADAIRTVTVKDDIINNPVVIFTNEKDDINVSVGEENDTLITAPKAVNEKGISLAVEKEIRISDTNEVINQIDWSKVGEYDVTYIGIHDTSSFTQQYNKIIHISINEKELIINGSDIINVVKRTGNCEIMISDLLQAGIKPNLINAVMSIKEENNNYACLNGANIININAKLYDNGAINQEVSKQITVNMIDGISNLNTAAPGKVYITGNSILENSESDYYNIYRKWVGNTTRKIDVYFETSLQLNTELSYFEWSDDCINAKGEIGKDSGTTGKLSWTTEGDNKVCIRAVTTTGIKGAYSDPINLLLDFTGPTTTFNHTWKDGENDWHNASELDSSGNLAVKYTGADDFSGIDHFEYTYDDIKGKYGESVTNPIIMQSIDGFLSLGEDFESRRSQLYIYLRAVDKAGNIGEWTINPAYVNIDTVKPFAPTLSLVNSDKAFANIKAAFIDGDSTRQSGFGKLLYQIDNGIEKEEPTDTIMVENSGKTTSNIKVWAVDKAGNKSETYTEKNVTFVPQNNANNQDSNVTNFPTYNGIIPESYKGLKYLGYSLSQFLIKNGTSVEELNEKISNAVKEVGVGTREATVAASLTLINTLAQYGYKLPYEWGGKWNKVGVRSTWAESGALDCSGFVNWAVVQANQKKMNQRDTNKPTKVIVLGPKTANQAVCEIGDALKNPEHITLVVDIDYENKRYIIAESSYGLEIRAIPFNGMRTENHSVKGQYKCYKLDQNYIN